MKNKSHTSGKRSLKIRKLMKALQTYVCITAIILSLVLSLASCKKSTQSSDNEKYAGSTVYGKITEINGNYVKALLGEFSGNDRNGPGMGDMGNPPELSDGESGGNSGSVDQGNSANTISSDGSYSGIEYISTGNNAMAVIDSGCTRNLTGDCTLTSLTNNGTINYNGYTITLTNDIVLGK